MTSLSRLLLHGYWQLLLSEYIRHDCDFRVVDGSTFTLEDFEGEHREKRPLLILNLTDTWPAMSRWLSPQFVESYGESPLPAFDPHKPRLKLGEYVATKDRLRIFGSNEVKRFAMPWLRNDFQVPEALVGVFEEPLLHLAGASPRLNIHDISFQQMPETWSSLVSGRYRWFLRQPDVMVRYPTAVRYYSEDMLEREASIFRCTQHPGDTVYFPRSWWSAGYVLAADSSNLSIAVGGVGDSMPVMAASVFGSLEKVESAAGRWKKVRMQSIKEANRRDVLPIHVAQNVAVLEFLHKYGADVNAPTQNGDSPLMEATRACLLSNMEWLIEKGANVSHRNLQGMTALHVACNSCHEEEFVEVLLLHSANMNEKTNDGLTPLHLAIVRGNTDVARLLVKHKAADTVQQPQQTPLIHMAAASNNEKMISWVMSRGGGIDESNAEGLQAIHVAAQLGKLQSLQYLVEQRADIQRQVTERAMAPMHFAVMGGHVSVLSWLHKQGADLKVNMTGGLTPIDAAGAMTEKQMIPPEVLAYLSEITQAPKRLNDEL